MSTELSDLPADGSGILRALGQIREYQGEVQNAVVQAFSDIDALGDELLAQETAREHAEQKALQSQIEQLASVAAQLARSAAAQERLARRRRHRHPPEPS